MPAFLLLAACCAVPIAAGAIALAASFKTGSEKGEKPATPEAPGKRFRKFRGASKPAEEGMN